MLFDSCYLGFLVRSGSRRWWRDPFIKCFPVYAAALALQSWHGTNICSIMFLESPLLKQAFHCLYRLFFCSFVFVFLKYWLISQGRSFFKRELPAVYSIYFLISWANVQLMFIMQTCLGPSIHLIRMLLVVVSFSVFPFWTKYHGCVTAFVLKRSGSLAVPTKPGPSEKTPDELFVPHCWTGL